MSKDDTTEKPADLGIPVEAMSEDQLLESLREAFHFLEGVPAVGAEVLERVVESLSEIVPEVTDVVSELIGGEEAGEDAATENSSEV